MKIQECIDILGRPINDEKVIRFIEKNGYKYPKKDIISNKKEDSSYWVKSKKTKVGFACSINIKNNLYQAIPANRKGSYYPLVRNISITHESKFDNLLFDINFSSSYDDLVEKLGEPTVKSSEIAQMWLKDGKETFYRWHKLIDTEKQIEIVVSFYENKNHMMEINYQLHSNESLFSFYSPLRYETFETYINNQTNSTVAHLMFLRWLIENDYVVKTDDNSELLTNIKNQEISILEYVKFLKTGYFGRDELSEHQMSIRRYIRNLNRPAVYYFGEFKELFGIDRHNDKTNIVEYNEENYQKVKKLLDGKDFTK